MAVLAPSFRGASAVWGLLRLRVGFGVASSDLFPVLQKACLVLVTDLKIFLSTDCVHRKYCVGEAFGPIVSAEATSQGC